MRTTFLHRHFRRRWAQLKADRPLYLATAALICLAGVVIDANNEPPIQTEHGAGVHRLASQVASANLLPQYHFELFAGDLVAHPRNPTSLGCGPSRRGASRLP